MNPSFIFFGTSFFAVIVLETLEELGMKPTLIVTETDKPKNRGKIITAPPVKTWALEHGISFIQPEKLDDETVQSLKKHKVPVFIVAEYGKILSKTVLDIPPHGVLNIHPSLLPKYRGPSPIQTTIMSGDTVFGTSIIKLDEEMDHGPVVVQKVIEFDHYPPRAENATHTLARESALLLAQTLPGWVDGSIPPQPQDDTKTTFTKKLTKQDGLILREDPAELNWRKFCAYSKAPGVFFVEKRDGVEKKIKITNADFIDNSFKILKVIPENRQEMNYDDFLRGNRA